MKIESINIFFLLKKKILLIIMRITLLLCCATVFSFSPYNVLSQNTKIKIDSDQIASVDEVFDLITEQTDYAFIYHEDLFKNFPKIELKKGTIKINKLIEKSLISEHYNIIVMANNNILIKNKTDKKFQLQVTGKVTDEQDMPLAGITIIVKGTTTGTVTNFDGVYTIAVPNPENALVFTSLGYKTQELNVNNRSVINVTMEEDISELAEVIVTGYQKLDVNKSTSAVSSVKGETLERKGNANILQSLEGQVGGLAFISDPSNEGNQRFNIRGVTSIEGDSQPLIVVDGFPLVGDISTINPYEIETITVLKDAAAASIYGARSANGVIVITTKKGKSGKLSVNYNTMVTMTDKPDLGYRINRVTSPELVDIQQTIAGDDPHSFEYYYNIDPTTAYRDYIDAPNRVYEILAALNEGNITQQEADNRLNTLRNTDNTQQFEDHFLQTRIQQQHNISVNGGSDRHTFRTSLNYTKTNGQWVGDESDRIILDILNTFKINDKLRLSITGNTTLSNNNSTPIRRELILGGISSYQSIIDDNGNPLPVNFGRLFDGIEPSYGGKDPFVIQQLIDRGLFDETYYPLKELGKYEIKDNQLAVRLQTRLEATLSKSLTGRFDFQYELGSGKNRDFSSAESWEVLTTINNTTPDDFNGDPDDFNIPVGARLVQTRSNRNSYTLRGQLDYNNNFGNHEISTIIGSEIRHIFSSSTTTDNYGFNNSSLFIKPVDKKILSQTIPDILHPRGEIRNGLNFRDRFTENTNRFFSLYGNLTYGLFNKYILSGSIRVDQSNLFGTDPRFRYKPFWSTGFKWRLGEEDFFKNDVVNKFDFRVSYGINGNVSNRFGPFTVATPHFFAGVDNLYITNPAVTDLRWERTSTKNFGVDLAVLNNRVNLSLDFYDKETTDLIAPRKSDPTLGTSFLVANDSNISNKGIEVALNTTNIQSDNFTWSTFLTFRHNKNRVLKAFTNETQTYRLVGIRNLEGAPANTYWMFNWNGLNEQGNGTVIDAAGDIRESNADNIFALSPDDLIPAGTADPIYTGALTNTLRYKDFTLSFMFIGSGGHVLLKDSYNGEYIAPRDASYDNSDSDPGPLNADVARAWRQPGDEATTDIPRYGEGVVSFWGALMTSNSTKNIIDGDFIKLREVILTYSLPNKFLNNKFKAITFNLRGNNLFRWVKNEEGIDPEAHGLARRFFRLEPSYSFGVNINF